MVERLSIGGTINRQFQHLFCCLIIPNSRYISKYPNAKNGLLLWVSELSKCSFTNFNELKQVYGNASIVGNNRVIFNIKGNDFRLVVSINFFQAACYVIWFGTHKEYDKINAETVAFNTDIQNFKIDE